VLRFRRQIVTLVSVMPVATSRANCLLHGATYEQIEQRLRANRFDFTDRMQDLLAADFARHGL
jgi:hypothetical protein